MNKIIGEIKMDDLDDPWGTGMEWLFAIAEVIYVEYGEVMPEFRPSRMLTDRSDLEGYAHETLCDMIDSGEIDQDDLEYAFEIMDRYTQWCRLAGRDY